MNQLAQAFAALNIPINWQTEKLAYADVKFYNTKTDKVGATIRMLVDTGASATTIGSEYAKPLGIDLTKTSSVIELFGLATKATSYGHNIKIQVGNLKPITAQVFLREKKGVGTIPNVIGWNVLNKYKLEVFGGFQKPQLRYSELAVAAMGNAGAYFRSRI